MNLKSLFLIYISCKSFVGLIGFINHGLFCVYDDDRPFYGDDDDLYGGNGDDYYDDGGDVVYGDDDVVYDDDDYDFVALVLEALLELELELNSL